MTDSTTVVQNSGTTAASFGTMGFPTRTTSSSSLFRLFLKMADEQTRPPFSRLSIDPDGLDWDTLHRLDGDPLEVQYLHTLDQLGQQPGTLGVIFRKAENKIQDPSKLKRLVSDLIDKEEWVTMDADVKGDAYEALLAKNAEDVSRVPVSTSHRIR